MSAYRGDPRVKAEFLTALSEYSQPRSADESSRQDWLNTWSDKGLLPPTVLTLLEELAGEQSAGPSGAMVDLAAMIEPGVELSAVSGAWLAVMLGELVTPLIGTEGAGAALAAIELHRRGAQGLAIDGKTWRETRKQLAPHLVPDDRSSLVLEVVAASCWDLDTYPGALRDTFKTWFRLLDSDARTANDWTEQDQADIQEAMKRIRARIEIEIGARPDRNEAPEAYDLYLDRFVPRLTEAFERGDDPGLTRHKRMSDMLEQKAAALKVRGREVFLDLVRGLRA